MFVFPLGGTFSKERWCIRSKHWQFWPSFANKEKMERVSCAQHLFSFLIPMHCLSIRGFTQTHPLSSIRILTNCLSILPTYTFTHTPYQKWITVSNSSTIFTQMQVYKRHKLPYNCILEQECEFIWSIKSIVKGAMLLLCHSTARLL